MYGVSVEEVGKCVGVWGEVRKDVEKCLESAWGEWVRVLECRGGEGRCGKRCGGGI